MKLLRDSWLLFVRDMRSTLRNPIWALIGLFQPLCFLFLFAPLLESVSKLPDFPRGGVYTVFVPGVMVMLAIFGTLFSGFGLIYELRAGVIERLRVTPVSRLALLLGKAARDVCVLLVQALLLVLIALPFGIKINLAGLGLTLVLIMLLGLCLSSYSYAVALGLKDENALSSSLNTLTVPLLLLSGINLPLTLAPPLIRTIAAFNPFAYAVSAARALFIGDFGNAVVPQGFAIMGVLTLLMLVWARHAFSHAMA